MQSLKKIILVGAFVFFTSWPYLANAVDSTVVERQSAIPGTSRGYVLEKGLTPWYSIDNGTPVRTIKVTKKCLSDAIPSYQLSLMSSYVSDSTQKVRTIMLNSWWDATRSSTPPTVNQSYNIRLIDAYLLVVGSNGKDAKINVRVNWVVFCFPKP